MHACRYEYLLSLSLEYSPNTVYGIIVLFNITTAVSVHLLQRRFDILNAQINRRKREYCNGFEAMLQVVGLGETDENDKYDDVSGRSGNREKFEIIGGDHGRTWQKLTRTKN